MLFKEKKRSNKKIPVRIDVILYSNSYDPIREFISIPEGGTYRIENFSNDLNIFYKDGNLCKKYVWQAGFTVVYEVIYEESNNEKR